jgi:hypothetical protein
MVVLRERRTRGRAGTTAWIAALLGALALLLGVMAAPAAHAVVPTVSAPEDFVIDVAPAVVNPNTGVARQQVTITNNGDTGRQASVLVNGVEAYAVTVGAGATDVGVVDVPDCVVYAITVDLGFGSLAFDTAYPPINCPSKVTIAAPPGPSSLTRSVTVTNDVAEQLSFVVFAFAEDGTDITNTPSPGDTSYTLDPGESVTFTATTDPLPVGQTRFYYLLLPVLGDEEVGRSVLFSLVPTPADFAVSLQAPVCRNGIPFRKASVTNNSQSTYLVELFYGDYDTRTSPEVTPGETQQYDQQIPEGEAYSAVVVVYVLEGDSVIAYNQMQPAFSCPPASLSVVTAPKVTGSMKRGTKAKAYAGTWSPTPTRFTYKWFKNGKRISGATKATFTIPRSFKKGTRISVKVTASKSGYTSVSKMSAKRRVK